MSFLRIENPTYRHYRREFLLALAYPFMRLAILFVRLYPKQRRAKFAKRVGKLIYKFNHKMKAIALKNLTMVYGNTLSRKEIEEMAKEVFINNAKSFIDFFATAHITDKKRFFEMIKVEGEEHLRAAYNRGKGVLCLVPHFSVWEFSAVVPPMLDYNTSAASKPIKGHFVQQMMVNFRGRRGMKNIPRQGSYQKLVNALHAGECVVIMIDQDTLVKGVFVDFFSKKAYTPMGVSRLALETGAAVVPMATVRQKDNSYKFVIKPELKTICTGNMESDLLENTQQQTTALEQIIRENPTQWVWMHNRWNTTPESLAEYLEKRAREKAMEQQRRQKK